MPIVARRYAFVLSAGLGLFLAGALSLTIGLLDGLDMLAGPRQGGLPAWPFPVVGVTCVAVGLVMRRAVHHQRQHPVGR